MDPLAVWTEPTRAARVLFLALSDDELVIPTQPPVTQERLIRAEGAGRHWETVEIGLGPFAGQEVQLRVYQLVLAHDVPSPGSASWRNLTLAPVSAGG